MELEDGGFLDGGLKDLGVDEAIGLVNLDANLNFDLICIDSMSYFGIDMIFYFSWTFLAFWI